MRRRNDAIHIDLVGLPRPDQSPGRVAKNANITVVYGADDAIGLLLAR